MKKKTTTDASPSTPRTEREPIGQRMRFEVFKRDSFKCQYCGNSAPDVVLHCDHIKPVAEGGATTILNLVTACVDCNLGKGKIPLSDLSAVSKRKAQLDQLQERRGQLDMLMQWQESLSNLDDDTVDRAADFWKSLAQPYTLTPSGIGELRKHIRKYSAAEVLKAMRVAATHYLKRDADGELDAASVNLALQKIPGICSVSRGAETDPDLPDLLYIKAIVRNRCPYYFDSNRCMDWLRAARSWGVSIEELKQSCKRIHNWSSFDALVNLLIKEQQERSGR